MEDTGRFEWQNDGSIVHLKGKEVDVKLRVGENILFELDPQGKEIVGDLAEFYIYKNKIMYSIEFVSYAGFRKAMRCGVQVITPVQICRCLALSLH